MTSERYQIRAMTRSEVDVAIAWATSEGWNPGLHDADCFYNTDPSGFLVGLLDNEPIASISAIKYGKSFGFIGFYIVKPALRGQSYGLSIWQQALKRLAGRNIGLDGVVAQQDNYIKSGFTLAHRNIRYGGVGNGRTSASDCVSLTELPIDTVCAYDRCFFPEDRSDFIQCWLTRSGSIAVGTVQGQTLTGYGVIRPSASGHKIGPLFADTADIADKIFCDLVAKVPAGSSFSLDVPAVNKAAIALAEQHGMIPGFETARMYTQGAPELPLEKIFGITTFELG